MLFKLVYVRIYTIVINWFSPFVGVPLNSTPPPVVGFVRLNL